MLEYQEILWGRKMVSISTRWSAWVFEEVFGGGGAWWNKSWARITT